MTLQQKYIDQHAALTTSQPWLQQLRQTALVHFLQQGFPTQRDEEWKYTNLNVLQNRQFDFVAGKEVQFDVKQLTTQPWWNAEAEMILFVDGQLQSKQLPQHCKSLVSSLDNALKNYISRSDINLHNSFTTLNTAFLQQGIVINLPRDYQASKPIYLVSVNTQATASQTHLRHIILAAENSAATIVEIHLSLNEQYYFANTVTQVHLAPHAKITHYKLVNEGKQAINIGVVFAEQNKASEFISNSMAISGEIVRSDTLVKLQAENANCKLQGLYSVKGKQHLDHHTLIEHQHANTHSEQYYKGILNDKARAVFNGKVIVKKDAQHITAKQKNKNLLLSSEAEIDTKPQLEIFADDVQCTHGATVGQLDPDALFYLQSRGIDEVTARHLLVDAFAKELTDVMPLLKINVV